MLSVPGAVSLLEEICAGRLPWPAIHPFPQQRGGDRAVGDQAVEDIQKVLERTVDPEAVDAGQQLPPDLPAALHAEGCLHLLAGVEHGGRGLSPFNAFRVIEAAAHWSTPAGMLLGIHNGIGAAAYLPVLPDGPLREHISRRMAAGAVTAMADTEPTGAANRARGTTAVPARDGEGYLLNGDKLYIGNGPIADLVAVTATLRGPDGDRTRVFFVDTDTPGFSVSARLRFMGFRGFPNGALSLRDVHVPPHHLLDEHEGVWLTAERATVLSRGRLYIVAAPALAIARACLDHTRAYARRRAVDGRVLAGYPEIRRMAAESQADTYALETVAQWTMLDGRGDGPAVNLMPEQVAAKNITSLLCWRVAERTMTLLAGEGFETARGKADRGVPPIPLERLFRDARGTRIAGGTEVLLQMRLAGNVVLSYFYPPPDNADELMSPATAPADLPAGALSARNRDHRRALSECIHEYARTCLTMARRFPERAELLTRSRALVLLGQLAEELVTMSLVLARAATDGPDTGDQDLADIYCTGAFGRIAVWRQELADTLADDLSAYARAAGRLLDDADMPAGPS
ncbi:acyl-CoA dehydrogenase family protein [Parafrankia sp. FMc2]|uniref:acyl-CoA dehydrogenase family protein n=1 Tax=Parafrankia sp. FMc2 TaxID=3233196 RepID=UPI0034D3A175